MEDKKKNRAMLFAVKEGRVAKIKSILDDNFGYIHKMTPFGSWLHVAAGAGQLNAARYFIDNGIDINQKGGVAGGNSLNYAAQEGQKEMVCFLLDNGAKFDTTEPERNALFSAIYDGHTEIAKVLVNAGIDTAIKYTGKSMKGMGVLEFAKERGHLDVIEYIESVTKNT